MMILQLWVQLQVYLVVWWTESPLAALFYHILADGSWSHEGTVDIHLMSIAMLTMNISAG